MLGEISSEEDAGRGMLTGLVVHKQGDMQPGWILQGWPNCLQGHKRPSQMLGRSNLAQSYCLSLKSLCRMQFRIADSFTKALGKLNAQEQSAAKITVFDLQQDPSEPGLQFHRIDKSKDPNFWSIRSNRDIRLIVHKTAASFLICYVDHHDDAYKWAERRRIETHPKTGAAQIVEVRERIEEIALPIYSTPEPQVAAVARCAARAVSSAAVS